MMLTARVQLPLAAMVSLALMSCSAQQRSGPGIELQEATAVAEHHLNEAYPQTRYKRQCATLLEDGYVFTFREIRAAEGDHIDVSDVPPMPVIAVTRNGQVREAARAGLLDSTPAPLRASPMDSASIVEKARRLVPQSARLHCVLHLAEGAWVEFLPADGSASSTLLGGTVVGVTPVGPPRIVMNY